ncbi:MAG: hypothetical protein KDH94_05285, partial [Coxiellaceae bacterium]|nr:hypothetical protein [Coxiellaceae bacterium]
MRAYIHFTNSAILPLLVQTHFKLISLDAMLYEYGFAPLSGEIDRGGVQGISADATTAFAEITSDQNQKWNINKLYSDYGEQNWKPSLNCQETFIEEARRFING